MRALMAVLVLVGTTALSPVPSSLAGVIEIECPTLGDLFTGVSQDDAIAMSAEFTRCWIDSGSDGDDPTSPERPARIVQFVRIPLPLCGEIDVLGQERECIPDADPWICPDGSPALGRAFQRVLDAVTFDVLVNWYQVDRGGCPLPPEVEVLITEYFTTVQLTPAAAGRNPTGAQGLVNLPLVLFADPAPQVINTVLGGWPVEITATPTIYTWDLGPAGQIVTEDPGAPYPDHTVSPTISVLGELPIVLTASWVGTFRINGTGGVYPINGIATTVTTLDPITITEARTYLVTENY